ncbi:MAG: ABC transporter permease [Fusobacteriaceae bacterium]
MIRNRDRGENLHKFLISIILFVLFLPVIGTFLYSISSKWTNTILPTGLTIKWYVEIFKNSMFLSSMIRSFYICFLALIIIVIIMIPTIFIVTYYYKKLEKFMELLVLICFAIPGAVLVVGLLKLYSSEPFKITGTLYILLGVYFIISYPFVYRGIKNSIDGLNLKELIESANILGSTTSKAFVFIIIPNIIKGISVSLLLTFSMLFGEFLLVNMLVGGRYQTIQMYINSIRSGYSGHYSSALVITYFFIVFISTGATFLIKKKKEV